MRFSEALIEKAIGAIRQDGFIILDGIMGASAVAEARAALAPELGREGTGRNQFEGFKTQRVYSLPGLSRAFDPFFTHELVLSIIKPLLWDDCLLTAALAANVLPGERAQAFHTDDAFYPLPRPRPALSVGAIWALDDFTADNGATQLIPGSHLWDDARKPTGLLADDAFTSFDADAPLDTADGDEEIVTAEMPAGSVLIFLGSLWHRAGTNRSQKARLGLFPQYCAAWVRQQENFTLGIDRDTVARMPEAMRRLIGYHIHPPFMGHVGGRHPDKLLK